MEAVAFLNARTARKLDDEFPELIDTLLNVIYPHYLSPMPSFSILQFSPGKEMTEPYLVTRETAVESEPFQDSVCRFKTAYSTTVFPIEVVDAKIMAQPFVVPINVNLDNSSAVLEIRMRCLNEGTTFSDLEPQNLRFYLNGLISNMFPLYELILNDTKSIAIATNPSDPQPFILDRSVIRPIGFEIDEGLLQYSSRSQLSYRIMTEFFVFPYKFLFFEIDLFQCLSKKFGDEMNIYFYFNKRNTSLERAINKESFLLGCTPIVNLFEQNAEPILLNHDRFEHRVIPDARQQATMVIHDIKEVAVVDSDGERKKINPFYLKNSQNQNKLDVYWSSSRKSAFGSRRVSDVFLSLTTDAKAIEQDDLILSVNAVCSNGDLPSRLPYGGGHPKFNIVNGTGPLGRISCIFPPTNIILYDDRFGHKWRLLSHLNLNYLSLTGKDGLSILKEIMDLYHYNKGDIFDKFIDGILKLEVKRGTARAPQNSGDPLWVDAVCRGLEIHILFDDAFYPGDSCFLFATVLERFFALYATINSYTRLSYSVRSKPGIVKKWRPRVGYRHTL
jgi:type VI secretion system protein ImpG